MKAEMKNPKTPYYHSSAVIRLTLADQEHCIERVELDAKSDAQYELVRLSADSWELHYRGFSTQNPKSGALKLSVWLTGNETNSANAIVSVKLIIV